MDLLVFHLNDNIVAAVEDRAQIQELLKFTAHTSGVLNMKEILKQYERTHDSFLAPFVPQYIATIAMFSALIAHRSGNSETSLDDIRSHASFSMAIFRDHVLPRPSASDQDIGGVLEDSHNKSEKPRVTRRIKGKTVRAPKSMCKICNSLDILDPLACRCSKDKCKFGAS